MTVETTERQVFCLYRTPALDGPHLEGFLRKLAAEEKIPKVEQVKTEFCFYIEIPKGKEMSSEEESNLKWLLAETFEAEKLSASPHLSKNAENEKEYFVEIGPRLSFSTAFSSNATSICESCGLGFISRIERSRRYSIEFESPIDAPAASILLHKLHDRMTECVYEKPLQSFGPAAAGYQKHRRIPVMEKGRDALVEISNELGLAFDDWDLDFYTKLFKDKLKRDPTDVECFDLAQSNSEHSRHWFFGGNMIIDGKEMPGTLFKMVKSTNDKGEKENNSVIAFHDNSSAIKGFDISTQKAPKSETGEHKYIIDDTTMHGILTCETHNFPCGIAPFPGAETGTGGRIRDVQATGRGAHVVAGTSSYCVGNLNIPGYELPWEDDFQAYPSNMAKPLQILIDASNGASDYGNKFGEPVVSGYIRSFGQNDVANAGERREWIKPIMMSAGVGLLDGRHSEKGTPEKGMIVVKVGGPAYRIGMGGGAASSRVSDEKSASLDFNAVQRGDAEMENKMNRVIRACIELGDSNPIISIHDQGAGGNGNVLKEISEPAGAELFLRRLPIGDETMTALELWGAEYQENNALLIAPESKAKFTEICERENMPYAYVGEVTGTGRVVVYDAVDKSDEESADLPVDLDLEDVLGKMPQKTFNMTSIDKTALKPIAYSTDVTLEQALDRVLRLAHIGSKRFLTTKVDRSVTGLVAQQQCVGPLHIPLANCAVISQSHFANRDTGKFTGVASSIGEQPIKGLINPGAMARLAVGEALTNLVWAKITALDDVKCSANWMWPAKLPGEGAEMVQACEAMCTVMKEIGISVDGGKDSLSMAVKTEAGVVKCPGQVCISTYAMCPDVTLTVTPDIVADADPNLIFIDLGDADQIYELGGSAFGQVFNNLGDSTPDLTDSALFVRAFNAIQDLIEGRAIAAGHDRSDGGLITALLEMSFAGNVGLEIVVDSVHKEKGKILDYLFSEALGLVIQPESGKYDTVVDTLNKNNVGFTVIGKVNSVDDQIRVSSKDGAELLSSKMKDLRNVWEATSFELDKLQASKSCVDQEQKGLTSRTLPPYTVSFTPEDKFEGKAPAQVNDLHRVAVIREEGSNGDREMAAAFMAAGFDVCDVTVSDLTSGRVTLDKFRGIVFVGGFSYADVMDSAKGWAGVIKFHKGVLAQFEQFYARKDTFSLGVCNGCQLMALLGWVPKTEEGTTNYKSQPRFIHNSSGRFESRFSAVKVLPTNKSILLKGMEGSTLGVWVAHGEGRAYFPESKVLDQVKASDLAPVRYVDDSNNTTEEYPFNPNGSADGIAALTSADGRHLAMMPHPERCVRLWQWPWMPESWKSGESKLQASPWLRMFQNAKTWCDEN